MKKIFLIALSLCMCLGAVACNTSSEEQNDTLVSTDTEFDTTEKKVDTTNTEEDIVFYPNAKIVNKNGAKGTVSYVIDDGYQGTASLASAMLDKYDSLTLSYAIQTKNFAMLETVQGNDGSLEYAKDANGNYKYTTNKANVDFWKNMIVEGRTEIISHTHTHAFWGTNDDGGEFDYFKTDGTLMTSEKMPKGSSTKELYATKQILKDLFGERAVSFVDAGIGVRTGQSTVSGVTLEGYKTYFNTVLKQAINSGDYIGSRGTFQATASFEQYVNTYTSLALTQNRMDVKAFMILNKNAGTDIKNWTNYIDKALEMGGWACFCIHQITQNESSAHHILQSQANKLFKYTEDLGEDVWVATFTDAMLYFSEWSSAKVKAEYSDGRITVELTDNEARNDVYNMPLTVKVTVPETWSEADCDGITLKVNTDTDGSKYVYVDIVPDTPAVEITKA